MPTYTLRNKKTGETWDVLCSYDEMQSQLNDNVESVIGTPSFITMHGGTLRKAGSEWRDVLGKIKKGAGKGNTIKT